MCRFCSGKVSNEREYLDYSSKEVVYIDNDFDLSINDEYYVTIAYCPICGRKLFDENDEPIYLTK